MPNYQNIGFVNDGVSNLNMPSFSQSLPNNLMKTNNPGGNLAGTAARAALGVATGGGSEIIAQILNLIPSIFQGITGASQLSQAKKIEAQNPRPEAVIAPSINKLVGYNYGQALSQDVPGGEMYRNEIKGATAAGVKAASELGSGSEAYGMLGQLVGREQNQFGDLAKLTADRVASKENAYANSLDLKASEENRIWDWNKAQPYLQAASIASKLRDSGMKNLYSGVANAAGSTAEAVSPDFTSSLLNGGMKGGTGSNMNMGDFMQTLQKYFTKNPPSNG